MTLRLKLTLAMVGIAVLSVLIYGLLVSKNVSQALLGQKLLEMQSATMSRAASISLLARDREEAIHRLGADVLLIETLDRFLETGYSRYAKRMARVLDNSLEAFDARWLRVSRQDGQTIAQAGVFPAGLTTPFSPGQLRLVAGQSSVLGLVNIELHRDRMLVGSLQAIVSMDSLWDLLKAPRDTIAGELFVVASPGADGSWHVLSSDSLGDSLRQQALFAAVAEALNREPPNGALEIDLAEGQISAFAQRVPETGSLLLGLQSTQALRAPARELQLVVLALGIGVALLAIAVGLGVASSIAAPVNELTRVAIKISEGDLEQRARTDVPGELGTLGQSFNRMTHALVTANASLESRVALRTRQLDESNQELRQRSAELERSNEELERFASIASHDLQEPLRKLQAFCGLLSSSGAALDEDDRDVIERIQASAERMRVLVNDLLALSRVSSDRQHHQGVDLEQIVAEVCQDLDLQIRTTQARVIVSSLPTIRANPLQMRQLFQNLLGNALKYVRSDVAPEVRIERLPAAKGLVIRMDDNGIGIEPQYHERVFGVFQRLHGRDEYPGTGIGLALCRRIIESHGGNIVACVKPAGEGARFELTLPQERLVAAAGGTQDAYAQTLA
ncbi:MAG: ATP-binding protein [Pseudomonadota bacterium]